MHVPCPTGRGLYSARFCFHCTWRPSPTSSSRSTLICIPSYADDTQLYLWLNDFNALSVMSECFNAVHRWFTLNGHAVSPDKSEATVVGTGARSRQESNISSVSLSGTDIPVSKSIRTLDSTMSFDCHVDKICKRPFYHTRALRHSGASGSSSHSMIQRTSQQPLLAPDLTTAILCCMVCLKPT